MLVFNIYIYICVSDSYSLYAIQHGKYPTSIALFFFVKPAEKIALVQNSNPKASHN